MTALLASLALTALRESTARARAAALFLNEVRVEELGRSGIDLALANLSRLEPDTRPDGPYALTLETGRVAVEIVPETGKADINRAPPALLTALLSGIGIARDPARRLAAEIVDWRDPNAEQRADATRSADYTNRGLPQPGLRPFADVSELALVLDMTPAILARFLPLVTVCSRLDKIDPLVGDGAMLRALFGGDDGRAEIYLEQRHGTDRPEDAVLPFTPSVREFLAPQAKPIRGMALRIAARAGGLERRFSVTACTRGDDGPARRLLSWRVL